MATKIIVGSAEATEFHGLANFEQQVQWCINRLAALESTYNAANPNNTVERVTVTPNYDTNTVASTVNLQLSASAVTSTIVEGVQAYLV